MSWSYVGVREVYSRRKLPRAEVCRPYQPLLFKMQNFHSIRMAHGSMAWWPQLSIASQKPRLFKPDSSSSRGAPKVLSGGEQGIAAHINQGVSDPR